MRTALFRWVPRLARWLYGYGDSLQCGGRPAGMPLIAWLALGNGYAWEWRNYRHPHTGNTIWEASPAMRFWCRLGGQVRP